MRKKGNKSIELIIKNRFYIFLGIIIALFSIVMIKITNVMLFQEDIYKESLEHLTYTKVTGTSSPRGRIYDRNYNIIVDNKSLKTITYQKPKKATSKDMIKVANKLAPHITLNYSRLTLRNKKEYFCAKNVDTCN